MFVTVVSPSTQLSRGKEPMAEAAPYVYYACTPLQTCTESLQMTSLLWLLLHFVVGCIANLRRVAMALCTAGLHPKA